MVLPAIALLLGLLGVTAQHGVALVRAQDAASVAARIAIVDTEAEAREAALAIAGDDATIGIVRDGVWVRVTVSDPGPWGLVARATAVTRAQD
ncbi:MAG: TadE family protein [Demequinaceae bacterium]|nr:TadE family protein [Demequinaceae bacterium]